METNGGRRAGKLGPGDNNSHPTDTAELLRRVKVVLGEHPMLHGYTGRLSWNVEGGTLKLSGSLPTFHLKQVLQTTLRNLPGVSAVENRVEVIAPRGLGLVKSRSWEFT